MLQPRRLLLVSTLGLALACGGAGESSAGSDSGSDSVLQAILGSEERRIDYASMSSDELVAAARELQARVVTLDSHADIPFDYATPSVNPCTSLGMQVDVPKMREGGLSVVVLNVWVPQLERTPETYERAREQAMTKFRAIHRFTEEFCPIQVSLATHADDVERMVRDGRLVVAIGMENGFPVGSDLSLLTTYKQLGAIYMSLTHSAHNDLADSSTPREAFGDAETEHGGVSALGARVIAEMNRVGIMVDVSHASKAAALDAIRLSRAPVIASHSSVRALTEHVRNMDDETMRALAEKGGVMQIVALGEYVKAPGTEKATVADFVNHIDYAVRLIGIDHVGIASDFDGGGGVVGWKDASETVNVTAELLRRGYSEQDVAKIWGGNLIRVWGEVERQAGASALR